MSDFGMKLDIINENDDVIGTMESEQIHKEHLLHRSVHVIVRNGRQEFYVRKRSDKLELYPGVWTSSVGEHVFTQENYQQTATRALKDFLGLNTPLDFVGKARVEDKIENELMAVFLSSAEEIPYLNPDHSEAGEFVSLSRIEALIRDGSTTPHLKAAIGLVEQLS